MDADLADAVRQFSGAGIRRVLAIATPTARLAPDDAWRLLSEGASDVFAWDHSARPADEVAARLRRWTEVEEILESSVVRDNLVGKSPAWSRVLRQIIEVARFTDCSILVTGESGTGKELVARLVHALDPRADKGRLVVLDCTTVVPSLSGSEFFGHERGAFTGAVAPRDGAFALADGGTLFLDEVGELPLHAAGRAAARRPGGHVQARRQRYLAHHAVPAGLCDEPRLLDGGTGARSASGATSTTGSRLGLRAPAAARPSRRTSCR